MDEQSRARQATLDDRYIGGSAVRMTRGQLWDMEVRKAWDPLTYIPVRGERRRIVVLTDEPDDRYREPFAAMVEAGWLPGFLEIYIERDLGVVLRRR